MDMSKVKCPKCHKTSMANSMYQMVPGGKWYCRCSECGKVFEVDVPEGRIVMMFAKDETHEYFTDSYQVGNEIITFHAFATPEEFVEAWKKMVEHPDGMWYWVYDNLGNTMTSERTAGRDMAPGGRKVGGLICSGACDPLDADGFEDYFDIPIHNKRFKLEVTCKAETYIYAPDAQAALRYAQESRHVRERAYRRLRMKSADADSTTKLAVYDEDGNELSYTGKGGDEV